jgi:hypothetical protein
MADDNIPNPLSEPPNQNFFSYLRRHALSIVCGFLMILGLIIAFFFVQLGGILVGLSLGLVFFEESVRFFTHIRKLNPNRKTFTILMILGKMLYLLFSIPLFLLATLLGLGIRALVHWGKGNRMY